MGFENNRYCAVNLCLIRNILVFLLSDNPNFNTKDTNHEINFDSDSHRVVTFFLFRQ